MNLRTLPRVIFPFILLLPQTHALGQDMVYARKVVDTLASPQMHGRGYVNKGDRLAAAYIAAEFKKAGLVSFNKAGSPFQYFSFPVNSFPGKMSLAVEERRRGTMRSLLPGEDFILRSSSPSVKGKFTVVRADRQSVATDEAWQAFRSRDLRKTFVYVDTSGISDKNRLRLLEDFVKYPRNVAGIILPVRPSPYQIEEGHLCTHMLPLDLSQRQSSVPVVEIGAATDTITAIRIEAQAKLLKNYTSQNVIGYVPGSQYPDSFIVFTAHYDHLGHFGKAAYFPGANDNASGVAMLLNLAKYYGDPAHRPRCSVVFIAFGAEEVGLIGSRVFAESPLFPLSRIRFLVNMDILGTGDEGVTVVNATLFRREFSELQRLNADSSYLPQVKSRGKASISDHHFFTEKGVPCFYFYTLGGIKAYHDVCDRSQTLPLTRFNELFRLLRDFTGYIDNR